MITEEQRVERIEASSKLIGKAVFNSILITLVSFSPILFLTGQEHKLFSPLVWTKTFAMIGSAFVDAAGGAWTGVMLWSSKAQNEVASKGQ